MFKKLVNNFMELDEFVKYMITRMLVTPFMLAIFSKGTLSVTFALTVSYLTVSVAEGIYHYVKTEKKKEESKRAARRERYYRL